MPNLTSVHCVLPFPGSCAEPCSKCIVRASSFCGALDPRYLDRLADVVTVLRVDPHREIAVEGDRASHLFNITSGAVKVYKMLPDGRQQVTGFMYAGDILGLSSIKTYAVSAEALTPVEVCRFSKVQLDELIDDFPKLERRLLEITSNELAEAQEQMLLLGRKTAKERLATFLVGTVNRIRRSVAGVEAVTLPMTRSDIADYLGLTVETVSRNFSQLKREGLIEILPRGDIKVVRFAELEHIASAD